MSVEGHIQALKDKHENLEALIKQAELSPGSDDLTIHELKKEKLKIKDELHQLGAV